jgi:hypothetical protein
MLRGFHGSSKNKCCAFNTRESRDLSKLFWWQSACNNFAESRRAPGGFVKKIQTLSFLATLAIALGMISWGSALHAQDSTPSTTPNSQAQQPSSTPDTTPTPPPDSTDRTPSSSQSPDATAPNSQMPNSNQSPDASTPANRTPQSGSAASGTATDSGSQTFSGTVTKQGDKYVLKDDSGKTYDIDHQDEVKKFDGKRVRVQGTLDPATNKIMVK